ncbi:MAG TPA: tyrosine-type recombinase/integrase [Bryobacteraceae bacterium]|nr:tyrosine-type recombinase/integrase [Bryobacteraceae bacterium]
MTTGQTIDKGIKTFLAVRTDLAPGTLRNYRRTLKFFQAYVAKAKLDDVDKIKSGLIDTFRTTRAISALTWTKEFEILRQFFRYCVANDWTGKSPAAAVKTPHNIQPTDKEPYSRNEIIRILAACDGIGRRPYERLRARAMTLLLRYTALRISDVALLAKDRIRDSEIHVRTMKNGKRVMLPVHPELQAALDVLPEPMGIAGGKYFFWSGNGTVRCMVRNATRTMATVFKMSIVVGAHAHRFRHTLATENPGSQGFD